MGEPKAAHGLCCVKNTLYPGDIYNPCPSRGFRRKRMHTNEAEMKTSLPSAEIPYFQREKWRPPSCEIWALCPGTQKIPSLRVFFFLSHQLRSVRQTGRKNRAGYIMQWEIVCSLVIKRNRLGECVHNNLGLLKQNRGVPTCLAGVCMSALCEK